MNTSGHTTQDSSVPAPRDDQRPPRATSKVGTPLGVLAMSVGAIAVMVPWPLVGILLLRSQFDEASEAFFFFGGITLFPLMILALFGSAPEEVLIAIFMFVWLLAAVVPALVLRRRLTSWWIVAGLLGVQSVFALAQAMMGAMLIIGKSI